MTATQRPGGSRRAGWEGEGGVRGGRGWQLGKPRACAGRGRWGWGREVVDCEVRRCGGLGGPVRRPWGALLYTVTASSARQCRGCGAHGGRAAHTENGVLRRGWGDGAQTEPVTCEGHGKRVGGAGDKAGPD